MKPDRKEGSCRAGIFHPGARYAAAAIAVGAAFLLRQGWLAYFGAGLTSLTYSPAVLLSALLGGVGPGLLATAMAAVLVSLEFLPLAGPFPFMALPDAVGLAVFSSMAVSMSIAAGRYRPLVLPQVEEIAAAAPSPDRPVEPAAETVGLRILLADDDPAVRGMIRRILGRRGWRTKDAGTGREAVATWQEGDVDVVLMDVQMPEMDGLEATGRIREMERGKDGHTCIIGLTAHARREIEEQCRAAGMDAFLTKPVRMRELCSAIEGCRTH